MKNTKKGRMAASILSALLCAGLALFSAGCGSDSDSSESGSGVNEVEQDSSKGITSVTLDRATLTLLAESTAELTATVTTTSADIAKTVTWTSSDESVATVSDGTVTAVAAGSATITAASTVDTTKKATCSVTVESATIGGTTTWDFSTQPSNIGTTGTAYTDTTIAPTSGSSATLVVTAADLKWATSYLQSGKNSKTYENYESQSKATFTLTTATTSTVKIVMAGSGSDNETYRWIVVTNSSGEIVGKIESSVSGTQQTLTLENIDSDEYTIYTNGTRIYSITVEGESSGATIVYPSAVSLSESSLSLDVSDGSSTKTATLTATIANASEVTSGKDTIEWTSSNTKVATVSNGVVTAKKAGTATITASCTYGGKSATCEVTVTGTASGKTLSASDTPVGYASITPQTGTGTTVTTKTELVNALQNGGLIYVSGTIDVSEGCLPSEAGGTTAQLDAFVAANSTYSTYSAFKTAYAGACSASTNDKSSGSPESTYGSVMWTLNKAYGNKIKLSLVSNTTIIGLDGAVIKGGTFQISGVSNVTIRNLTIQDAYDPFPHHEKNDGFNAQWDGICLDGASNIWIDHCTIEDTMKYSKVAISGGDEEKWQTYDGLCDMKGSSKNIVVSYCIFKNHDKTMLIGSGSGDTSGGYITIHHNKFLNCGQRLPMTTYPNMHVYNNSFERDSDAYYSQQACIVGRYAAYTYVVESNYFGSGVKKCLTKSTSAAGSCYSSGNYFVESSVTTELVTSTSTKPFTPSYSYELDEASDVPTIIEENAGAGCSVSGI